MFDIWGDTQMAQVEERILKWVLVDEAVELLGISRSTLFRKISKGEIEAKKDGGTRYVGIISDTGMRLLTQVMRHMVTLMRLRMRHLFLN